MPQAAQLQVRLLLVFLLWLTVSLLSKSIFKTSIVSPRIGISITDGNLGITSLWVSSGLFVSQDVVVVMTTPVAMADNSDFEIFIVFNFGLISTGCL